MSLYFIRMGKSGPVKIGFSKNPNKRLESLQISSPERLIIIRVVEGTMWGERAAHRAFQKYRLHGEWFRFRPEMLSWMPPAIHHRKPAEVVSPVQSNECDDDPEEWEQYEGVGGPMPLGIWRTDIAKWSPHECALVLGITEKKLFAIERGRSVPSAALMAVILGATDGWVKPADHVRAWFHAHKTTFSQSMALGQARALERQ